MAPWHPTCSRVQGHEILPTHLGSRRQAMACGLPELIILHARGFRDETQSFHTFFLVHAAVAVAEEETGQTEVAVMAPSRDNSERKDALNHPGGDMLHIHYYHLPSLTIQLARTHSKQATMMRILTGEEHRGRCKRQVHQHQHRVHRAEPRYACNCPLSYRSAAV